VLICDTSSELVADCGVFAQRLAELGAAPAARSTYEGFSFILKEYNKPRGISGFIGPFEFDLAMFLGHELFVTFFAHLIGEQEWELVSDLLDREIFVDNPRGGGVSRTIPFTEISRNVQLLDRRKQLLGSLVCALRAGPAQVSEASTLVLGSDPFADQVRAGAAQTRAWHIQVEHAMAAASRPDKV
jgi:hypothetical protein